MYASKMTKLKAGLGCLHSVPGNDTRHGQATGVDSPYLSIVNLHKNRVNTAEPTHPAYSTRHRPGTVPPHIIDLAPQNLLPSPNVVERSLSFG